MIVLPTLAEVTDAGSVVFRISGKIHAVMLGDGAVAWLGADGTATRGGRVGPASTLVVSVRERGGKVLRASIESGLADGARALTSLTSLCEACDRDWSEARCTIEDAQGRRCVVDVDAWLDAAHRTFGAPGAKA